MNVFFSPVQYTAEHEGSELMEAGHETQKEKSRGEKWWRFTCRCLQSSLSSWIPFPLLSISCSVILSQHLNALKSWDMERRRPRRGRERPRDKELPHTSSSIFRWFSLSLFASHPWSLSLSWYLLCLRCLSQSIFTSLLFLDSLPFFEDVVFIVFSTFFSWCESVCFSKEFISCSRLKIFHQDFLEEKQADGNRVDMLLEKKG